MSTPNRNISFFATTKLTMPIGKLLWKFGIPSLVGMLSNALHNTIDAYFLGTESVEAVAAVGLVFRVLPASVRGGNDGML